MADNVTLNAGSGGAVIKTDDDGVAHWPYTKLAFGADNTQTIVGSISSNPLPVALSATDNAVLDNIDADTTTIAGDTTSIDGKITACDTGAVVISSGNVTTTSAAADNNVVSTNNSSVATLGISGNFTGTGDDVSSYSTVTIQVDSSHDSAASGMTFEFSTDNTNWDDVYTFTYTAADGARRFQFPVTAQYFRVNYTNGGTGQTHFRLQTILHKSTTLTSVHRLGNNIDPDRSSQLTSSVILAQAGGSGDFVPVQASAAGNFKIALEEYDGVPVGGGTEAGALRVTMANDSTGVMTVDGTVTANLSATDNAVLDTIDAVLDTINAKLVTGTVIGDVNLGATDNAVLDSIVTNTTGLAGTVSGSELQVDVVGALPAGTNAIGKLAANTGVDIGDVDVTSISAGSNLIGDVGISGARTSGGTTIFRSIDLDESEEEIKATAGQVYWIHAMNLKASMLYLKFYNATAATVVVGTTTPVLTFPLATQGDTNGAGFTLSIPNGIAFGTAITVACTTGIADADTGAPGANECVVNIGYA